MLIQQVGVRSGKKRKTRGEVAWLKMRARSVADNSKGLPLEDVFNEAKRLSSGAWTETHKRLDHHLTQLSVKRKFEGQAEGQLLEAEKVFVSVVKLCTQLIHRCHT